jgi:hypothetical protein
MVQIKAGPAKQGISMVPKPSETHSALNVSFYNCFMCLIFFLTSFLFDHLVTVVNLAMGDATSSNRTGNATKDNIARLLHLYKDTMAQRHWSNLYGILSRAELDGRKSSGVQSKAANPLCYLAEQFNDYESFQPQNLMVHYVCPRPNMMPVKRQPSGQHSRMVHTC